MLALSGCSTPEERAAAAARRTAPTAVVMKSEKGQPIDENSTPHTKDGYPTFGPLTAANVQINDQQAAGLQSQLTALAASREAGTITQAEYERRVAEMRKLAVEHGPDTLSQIENK